MRGRAGDSAEVHPRCLHKIQRFSGATACLPGVFSRRRDQAPALARRSDLAS
jgi:hypothetical protein